MNTYTSTAGNVSVPTITGSGASISNIYTTVNGVSAVVSVLVTAVAGSVLNFVADTNNSSNAKTLSRLFMSLL